MIVIKINKVPIISKIKYSLSVNFYSCYRNFYNAFIRKFLEKILMHGFWFRNLILVFKS